MTEKEAHLRDTLRGFGRSNQAALERLAEFTDWPRIAAREIERRATSLVEALDEETLAAIASGELDFAKLCRSIATETKLKAA